MAGSDNRRTVGGSVEDNEASIDRRTVAIVCPCHCIGVATQTGLFLEQMDFVVRITERPEGAQTRNAAADNGYTFPLHFARVKHREWEKQLQLQLRGWQMTGPAPVRLWLVG